MDDLDLDRLHNVECQVRDLREDLLSAGLGIRPGGLCSVDHFGLLLFTPSLSDAMSTFRARDYLPTPPVPSVIVRKRVAERYGLGLDAVDIQITHLPVAAGGAGPRNVEAFLMCGRPPHTLIDAEREQDNEAHWAMRVTDRSRLAGLLHTLLTARRFEWDGGGFNRFEDFHHGGRTVCYLRCRDSTTVPFRRLELMCSGDLTRVVDQFRVSRNDEETRWIRTFADQPLAAGYDATVPSMILHNRDES